MQLADLAAKKNLYLAWRRITTGGNHQYKTYYRGLYAGYEVALESNLADLRQRLIGGSYEPRRPTRVYLPKESGLHRPLTLLGLEDQIVLQAFANIAAARVYDRRRPLQSHRVFSNLLQSPDSIFFFRRWQDTYTAFQTRASRNYRQGLRWVGDFDLAAFYDTISHTLLLKQLFPRHGHGSSSALDQVSHCLRTWSSELAAVGHDHGLPQGPLASDFLAECFLLPIDLAFSADLGYIRYVDDVRLFGATEDDVRAKLIRLETLCREQGLIPQTGKFAIKRMSSVRDAVAMLPSLTDPQHAAAQTGRIPSAQAGALLAPALTGRPHRVVDKTRLRYVLYRAEPDASVLGTVLRLLPRHPEHADAFFHYIAQFGYRKPVADLCVGLVADSPYGHIRGEAWHVLARYQPDRRMQSQSLRKSLVAQAREAIRAGSSASFSERWGAAHFLCAAEAFGATRSLQMLRAQHSLLIAFLAPVLPDKAFVDGGLVAHVLRRREPEPGLVLASVLHQRRVGPRALGVQANQLPSQVEHVFRELGLVAAAPTLADPIADVLENRFRAPRGKSWRNLLGSEYTHAMGLLRQAEANYAPAPSVWLALINSFNQTVFLALQGHLAAVGAPGACTIRNRHGDLVDFGVTLDINGPFSRAHPGLAACFRSINTRRNSLPTSHPYEKRSSAQATYLSKKQRDTFTSDLAVGYADFTQLMP